MFCIVRLSTGSDFGSDGLRKMFLLLRYFPGKKQIFSHLKLPPWVLPLTSFAISVSWILLSGTRCRLLEIQKTKGNRKLSVPLMSANSASSCASACLFHGVCVCVNVCVCVHMHLRFLESPPGLGSPPMVLPKEIFLFTKLNWYHITELERVPLLDKAFMFQFPPNKLLPLCHFSILLPWWFLWTWFFQSSLANRQRGSAVKEKQDGLWTSGLCWVRIPNSEIS